eukprot:3180225-Rhodomonas_salina.1
MQTFSAPCRKAVQAKTPRRLDTNDARVCLHCSRNNLHSSSIDNGQLALGIPTCKVCQDATAIPL